jgi:hypothetical protein
MGTGISAAAAPSRRAGECAVPFTHSGTYTVENAHPPMYSGERAASSCVILTHADASSDSMRGLRFMVLDGDAGKLVASGTLFQS